MKRKVFKELMRQTAGNILINMELNTEAMEKEGADLAVLRGTAYGMAAADALVNMEPMEFDLDLLATLIEYSKKREDVYAESGAVATVSKLYGREVSVDE